MEAALNKTVKEQILDALNDEQKKPVRDYEGGSIIIAGAGAGKTRVIVYRTAYMIEDGVPAKNILLFTFTRKGAQEIKDRVRDTIGAKANDVTVGTYHSFCARLLRNHIGRLGTKWNDKFSIYDAEDSMNVIKNIQKKSTGAIKTIKPAVITNTISRWKEELLTPYQAKKDAEKYGDSSSELSLIADIYQTYQDKLRDLNAIDFDDIIFFTIKLLEKDEMVRKFVSNRYVYIVADESQDSSPRDLRLIELLSGDNNNICLVGDDFQSIYGFRGSNIQSFFEFTKKHNLKRFYLQQNYRSTQNIVYSAQSVIDNNANQFRKTLFTENKEGEQIKAITFKTDEAEAEGITGIIKKILFREGYKGKDIAILYRSAFQSRKIEDKFISFGVPYKMLSGVPFYGRMEVKDITSYLTLLINPLDFNAFKRAAGINAVKRGLGETTLEKIKACIDESKGAIMSARELIDCIKGIEIKGKGGKGLKQYISVLEELNTHYLNGESPLKMLKHVVRLTGYDEYLNTYYPEEAEDKLENLEELYGIANAYDTLEEFIGNISVDETDSEASTEDKDEDKVRMLTIHGSKGLEWPVVFIVGCSEKLLPHEKCCSGEDLEEERRLFYVGMTRAQEKLFLTNASRIFAYGQFVYYRTSRFVNEINEQYIKRSF